MKKFLILLFLMAIGISVYAQKSYITVNAHPYSTAGYKIYLTGDVPSGINNLDYYAHYCESDYYSIGEILNILVGYGYEVEMMVGGITMGSAPRVQYLLSKKISSNEDDAITIVHNDDGEAYEVARYNLQGMQVNENTKGIQIIVYSNYTTKTVIVE